MHDEARTWLLESLSSRRFGQGTLGKDVLDIGGRNINGSVKEVLGPDGWQVTAIDAIDGPGVDVVTLAHQYNPGRKWPVVTCLEVLEHDPHWIATLLNAKRLCCMFGIIIVTCAGPDRKPHRLEESPTDGYYENRTLDEVVDVLELPNWQGLHRGRGNDLLSATDVHYRGLK